MAPDSELSKRVDHLEKTCGDLETDQKGVLTDVHEFMLAQIQSTTEIAAYVKNAAENIEKIEGHVKDQTDAIWEALNSHQAQISQEVTDRKVQDTAHDGDIKTLKTEQAGAIKTLKVDLTGKIRMSGYAKIIAFISAAALAAWTSFLGKGG